MADPHGAGGGDKGKDVSGAKFVKLALSALGFLVGKSALGAVARVAGTFFARDSAFFALFLILVVALITEKHTRIGRILRGWLRIHGLNLLANVVFKVEAFLAGKAVSICSVAFFAVLRTN